MAYKVIILYQLYMPSYFLGTFTEYPYLYSSSVIGIGDPVSEGKPYRTVPGEPV